MAVFVRYIGPAIEYRNRVGLIVYKRPNSAKLFFRDPPNQPMALSGWLRNQSFEKVYPERAYPPIHKYERFQSSFRVWDVAEAWNIILKSFVKVQVSLKSIESWHKPFLDGLEFDVPFDPKSLETQTLRWACGFTHEQAMSDEVDLSIPLIFVEIDKPRTGEETGQSNTAHFLIDGWKRLHKAYILQQPLTAYILTQPEEQYIRLR